MTMWMVQILMMDITSCVMQDKYCSVSINVCFLHENK